MTEPRLTIVDGRFINYGDRYLVTVVADPDVTPDGIAAARAALVAAVRDADTLHQASEFAAEIREHIGGHIHEFSILRLLDLLAPVPDTGAEP